MQSVSRGAIAFIWLSRLENSVLPLIGMLAGYLASQAHNQSQLALNIVVLILAHSVLTVWNDIADEEVDRLNKLRRISSARQKGTYPAIRLGLMATTVLLVVLSYFLQPAGRIIIAIFLLIGWAYNSRPLLASRRPIFSIALLAIAYGFLPILMGGALGSVSWLVISLAVGWAAARSSLSLLKDYKDALGDAQSNKRTFLLSYGHRLTSRISFGLATAGYILIITVMWRLTEHHWLTITTLVVLASFLLLIRIRLFRRHDYPGLDAVFHQCLKYQVVFDCVVVAWLRTR